MSDKKNNTDSGKRRQSRSNYRPWLLLLQRVGIVAAVLIVLFLVWNNWDNIAPEALLDWTDETFGDAEGGGGYPCGIAGNSVVDMAEVNQHLALLSDTTLRFYNANATCVAERTHSFTTPTMYTAGNYVLLVEQGGNRLRLDTRRNTALELVLTNREIYAADLLSNGTTALVLNSTSQSYVSELEIRNAKGDVTFTHKNNKYLLMDVALSPNGKQVAAVGTTAENGVLKSVLLVISVSSGEVKEYADADVLLHNVSYTSKGAVVSVGDRAVWTLAKGAEQPEKHFYGGDEPVGYAANTSMVGIALRRAGTTDAGTVWVFNAQGVLIQKVEYEGTYRSLSANKSTLLLLTDRSMSEIKADGLKQKSDVPSDSLQAVIYRKKPLLLTLSELRRVEN